MWFFQLIFSFNTLHIFYFKMAISEGGEVCIWSSKIMVQSVCSFKKSLEFRNFFISRFWVTGVHRFEKDAQKITFSSEVAKFAGKIRIDLIMIFYINQFFWVTHSFWDIINFSNDCVHILLSVFWALFFLINDVYLKRCTMHNDWSYCVHEFLLCDS